MDTEGEFVMVAKLEEKILGFISIWPDDYFVDHLSIKNNYQRMGIGTPLLFRISESTMSALKLKCLKKTKSVLISILSVDGAIRPKVFTVSSRLYFLNIQQTRNDNTINAPFFRTYFLSATIYNLGCPLKQHILIHRKCFHIFCISTFLNVALKLFVK